MSVCFKYECMQVWVPVHTGAEARGECWVSSATALCFGLDQRSPIESEARLVLSKSQ